MRKDSDAGADHRRGAVVGDRDLAGAQGQRGRVAAVEVLGAGAEAAEVDDPPHPGVGRGAGEVPRAFLVARGEVAVADPRPIEWTR